MNLKFSLLILYFPLISFLICCGFGFFIGHNGSVVISTLFIFISFIISLVSFYNVLFELSWYIELGTWFQVDVLKVNYGFIFDPLSLTMSVTVCLISFLVHLYSINYMKTDPSRSRFMGYLSMFTFFMLVLIFSDNFVLFFFGWEGIGLSSYLLVGFWFTRIQANKSALKALFMNRIGDFFLMLGIIFIYLLFGSVDFLVVFTLVPFYQKAVFVFLGLEINMIFFITLLLFGAAVGKSAQIFLHTWLPDAMEGPTPVSALIHAATMVTAGIFLILRTSFIFEYATPAISQVLIWFGLLTIFLSSVAGCSQFDIKKIIAYSTCSQLGYMVLICGFSEYAMAFYHLVNHAFFKALLFLGAGSVIHSLANEQDIRRMGGLINVLPFTYSIFIIGSLALCGFPFLSGFFSKDPIILVFFYSTSIKNFFIFWLVTFSNVLTSFYSFRLIYYVFLSFPSGYRKIYFNIKEDTHFTVIGSLFILAVLSITSGFFLEDLFIGAGSYLFDFCLKVLPINSKVDIEFTVPFFIQFLSVLVSFTGYFFIFFFESLNFKTFFFSFKQSYTFFSLFFLKYFYRLSREKNHFNSIYNRLIGLPFLEKFGLFFETIDANLLEVFGPLGLNKFVDKTSDGFNKNANDSFFFYFSIFIISLIHIALIFIFLI